MLVCDPYAIAATLVAAFPFVVVTCLFAGIVSGAVSEAYRQEQVLAEKRRSRVQTILQEAQREYLNASKCKVPLIRRTGNSRQVATFYADDVAYMVISVVDEAPSVPETYGTAERR